MVGNSPPFGDTTMLSSAANTSQLTSFSIQHGDLLEIAKKIGLDVDEAKCLIWRVKSTTAVLKKNGQVTHHIKVFNMPESKMLGVTYWEVGYEAKVTFGFPTRKPRA
tara:strand:- start:2430 stop:2750 length:321 start_codon:yes stop_codon:yes gene_type:complete